MAAEVILYTTPYCPYCMAARHLLAKKGVDYTDINVDTDPALRQKMEELSGRRTVPQIFIDGRAIGGFDDLQALERAAELDAMLEGVNNGQ